MGITAGPKIGEILSKILKAKLDGKVRTRIDEERLVNQLR
jgi:hypothetical protein